MNDQTSIDYNRIPIIIMSFNRPNYLKVVLQSLREQNNLDWSKRKVALFQDNAVNKYSGRRHAEPDKIVECVSLFKRVFPEGDVYLAEANIGVCENFLRAEQWAFNTIGADIAYFFEDDLLLSSQYISIMDQLSQIALAEDRIGYFSAHGKHDLSLKDQEAFKSRLTKLGHHWGFGLRRSHWVDLQAWLEPYFSMVVGRDYRERPTKDILEHFRSIGIPLGVSSQDDIKKIGTYMLGRCSVNTMAVFGKYIGASGLHMNEQKFEKLGYANTAVFNGTHNGFEQPTKSEIDNFIEAEINIRWKNIKRSQQGIDTKPNVRQLDQSGSSSSSASNSSTETPIVKRLPGSENPEMFSSFPDSYRASNHRVIVGEQQRGFAHTDAQSFVGQKMQSLFEFRPISVVYIKNQLCLMNDEAAEHFLKKVYLVSDDRAKVIIQELDLSVKNVDRRRFERSPLLHARDHDKISALLVKTGFDDIHKHQWRLPTGDLISSADSSVSDIINPFDLSEESSIIIGCTKRRRLAPDFFNHSFSIKTKRCVDENFEQVPWMTYPAIEFIKQIDFAEKKVFEYGSGNSTAFWSRRCASVISVEHNRKWYDEVIRMNLTRSSVLYAENREQYVHSVQNGGPFDVIVIDGQFRDLCAVAALPMLAPKGMLILDNAERYPKTTAILRDAGLIQIDFVGHSPIKRALSATSCFITRDFDNSRNSSQSPRDRWGLHDAKGHVKFV